MSQQAFLELTGHFFWTLGFFPGIFLEISIVWGLRLLAPKQVLSSCGAS